MDKPTDITLVPHFRDIDSVRRSWGLFFALGIILVILGCLAITQAVYATVFTVFLFSFLLIVAGIVQIIQAFMARPWSGMFLSLFLGILYLATGILFAFKPAVAAIAITLWIAALCFIGGIMRMATSAYLHFHHWGWVFFNGLVTFCLGVLIFADWPISGLWVIGLFVGIDLIFTGWAWVILSLAARNNPKPVTTPRG